MTTAPRWLGKAAAIGGLERAVVVTEVVAVVADSVLAVVAAAVIAVVVAAAVIAVVAAAAVMATAAPDAGIRIDNAKGLNVINEYAK